MVVTPNLTYIAGILMVATPMGAEGVHEDCAGDSRHTDDGGRCTCHSHCLSLGTETFEKNFRYLLS